jgi:hypothetical protein
VERTSSASVLVTQVELALLAGRNLEQIETEFVACGRGDKDEQATDAVVHAHAVSARTPTRRPTPHKAQNSHRRA